MKRQDILFLLVLFGLSSGQSTYDFCSVCICQYSGTDGIVLCDNYLPNIGTILTASPAGNFTLVLRSDFAVYYTFKAEIDRLFHTVIIDDINNEIPETIFTHQDPKPTTKSIIPNNVQIHTTPIIPTKEQNMNVFTPLPTPEVVLTETPHLSATRDKIEWTMTTPAYITQEHVSPAPSIATIPIGNATAVFDRSVAATNHIQVGLYATIGVAIPIVLTLTITIGIYIYKQRRARNRPQNVVFLNPVYRNPCASDSMDALIEVEV